jgi:hypothetical protein
MNRRTQEIDAIILFYEVKEAIKQKQLLTLMKLLFKSNFAFWKMISERTISRIRNKIFGQPKYIVLD